MKSPFFYIWYGLLTLCISANISAQSLTSVPLIKNYPKSIYKGGTQTWQITEGLNGLVFFANNDGLIYFDGKGFEKSPLPGKTILRSVFYDSISRRIYVGGQNEFGYFTFNQNGTTTYFPLNQLIPGRIVGFEDVWHIEYLQDKVYFQTAQQVFEYNAATSKIRMVQYDGGLLENMFRINAELYVTDIQGSIYHLINNRLVVVANKTGLDISSLLNYRNGLLLVTTYKNGLYTLTSNGTLSKISDNPELKSNRIYKAINYGNYFIMGTNRGGVYILDSNLSIINNIGVRNGLQNNNVLSLYKDRNNNIWTGLDNGIDLIRLNYPFGNVQPDGFLKGTGYCAVQFEGLEYFGTNNGLYVRKKGDSSPNAFQIVKNTEGQVWWIQEINKQLYMSHHEGLFQITKDNASKISEIRGCWKLLALSKHPGYYILGSYNGIYLIKWQNQGLSLVNKISRFNESSRFIEEDESGNIWIGHPYKGLYKIKLSTNLESAAQVRLYGASQGLPSESENYVFNSDLGLVYTASGKIFQYRELNDRFVAHTATPVPMEKVGTIKRILNGENGNVWVIGSQSIICLRPQYNGREYSYSVLRLPKLEQDLVGGFEFINESKDGKVYIGVESGFIGFNLKEAFKYREESPRVMVTSITSLSQPDSIFYRYIDASFDKLSITDRSIEFSYTSPNGYVYKDLQFSTKLEGWEKNWSSWKALNTREFSNLNYGDYTLMVKARYMGTEGVPYVIHFTIPAPWYFQRVAKAVYILLGLILIILIGFYPQMLVRKKAHRIIAEKDNKIEKQNKEFQIQREHQEQELAELKNLQLAKEIEHQGRELASSTLHIVQKSEMLLSIKDKLKHIMKISNDPKIKPELTELIKNIDQDTLIDKDWEKFELYFNTIHQGFTHVLKSIYPSLTANDIKMCAYLRMNLSTKEIAGILNITTRGVEISRYRLRKKMNLDSGVNLTEYLTALEQKKPE